MKRTFPPEWYAAQAARRRKEQKVGRTEQVSVSRMQHITRKEPAGDWKGAPMLDKLVGFKKGARTEVTFSKYSKGAGLRNISYQVGGKGGVSIDSVRRLTRVLNSRKAKKSKIRRSSSKNFGASWDRPSI